jgi:UDP-2,3-diacylglucosamine pyrophosphatase LpxH
MPDSTIVLVVSDLHLGGQEGFRMCSPAGAARLAAFFRHAAAERAAGAADVHLVLAGDVVDLLAEPDAAAPAEPAWSAFAADPELALAKVERILASTAPVWDALRDFVADGNALTVLVGNHDVELALPRVRARLLARVAPRGGRVSILHDNEGFTLGGLIVEHGNRYDPWNAVDHDGLRRLRSSQSRREPAPDFSVQPGSELVARVMNRVKARYSFVDLMKPETGAVVPILAVLDPGLWLRAGPAIAQLARMAWRKRLYDAEGRPTDELIRAGAPAAAAPRGSELVGAAATPAAAPPAPPLPDEDALALADELAAEAAVTGAARGDELVGAAGGGGDERVGVLRDVQLKLLLRAFRKREEKDRLTFGVDEEVDPYRSAARRLVASGFEVVVFGHTHHAKRVTIDGGTYLNTGTWADLMRIPPEVYAGPEADGIAALRRFLDDVRRNDVERFRRQVATFARVTLDGNGVVEGRDVLFFDGDGPPTPLTQDGVLDRLLPGRSS